MTYVIAASAALGILALLLLLSFLKQLRRGRVVRASGSLAGGAASASLGTAGVMMLISYTGYHRLIEEQSVAVLEFSQTAPEVFTTRVMLDGQLDKLLELRGNEWQLDARVITWQPPATVLGLDPVYQLERISGRYTSIEREQTAPRTVHSLSDERPLDLWSMARRFPTLAPGVDAYYGTATYVPMADGARFQVTLSRDALITRPLNDAAREALGNWSN